MKFKSAGLHTRFILYKIILEGAYTKVYKYSTYSVKGVRL